MHVGKVIKEVRRAQKMSLTALSKSSGVQIATLSRIEKEKMTGTLDSHIAIARALGVDLTKLYSDLDTGPQKDLRPDKQTPKSAAGVFVHSNKSAYEILTGKVLDKKMMPILLKIEPQGRTNTEQNPPGTEKFVFVLEGKVEVTVGGETYPLLKSNTLYFDASLPYYIMNAGAALARVLCVSTPVAL